MFVSLHIYTPKMSSIKIHSKASVKGMVPNPRNADKTKLQLTHNVSSMTEILLSSSLTDNAIRVHVLCLLQLDLELSVQCPISVDEGRSTTSPICKHPVEKTKITKGEDLLIA
jgi:hypothetical protein